MNEFPSLTEDKTFRRIVVASTGLGIAFMLASLAALQFGKAEGLRFQWHWSIAVVILLGLYWNSRFWRIIWQAQEPTPNLRRKITFAFTMLFALGLATFLYPMRFVSPEHHLSISSGLVTAIIFLGITAALIVKMGRAFMAADAAEARRSIPLS